MPFENTVSQTFSIAAKPDIEVAQAFVEGQWEIQFRRKLK